ncbi:hypothetical protein HWV62_6199 [Athelia sp. TMB]|nr:hypothetical protein HWV62_6199 [Athelia sp. TMB]
MPSNILSENAASFTQVLASISTTPEQPHVVSAEDEKYTKEIWFKTEPVTREFCLRAAQIQLWTRSRDQGAVDEPEKGSWSFFEVVILENSEATEPRNKDGKDLVWHSHNNRLAVAQPSKVFGAVFDRRRDLLDDLEVGNVIAVRSCARFCGWQNISFEGQLIAKVMKDGAFEIPPGAASEAEIDQWVYTLTSSSDCDVIAEDHTLASKIWFTSPVLTQDVIEHIEDVRLFTKAHDQGGVDFPELGSWSWFDVLILESCDSTTPKVKNGRSLVWASHRNETVTEDTDVDPEESYLPCPGAIFDKDHELLNSLDVGNVIAVRVCAQFKGWENHAQSGRLVIRMSKNVERNPDLIPDDLTPYLENQREIEQVLIERVGGGSREDTPTWTVNVEPLRADKPTGKGLPPLRLLSLDGGGVRGVSSLSILKTIMAKVAGVTEAEARNLKPCEYFDMIAGTSTGGLIAIMLGRLHMTIGQVEDEYYDLSSKVFKNNAGSDSLSSYTQIAYYDAKLFEECIKHILKNKSEAHDADVRLYEENGKCKVFVTACLKDMIDKAPPLRLRSYKTDLEPLSYPDIKIWEAARATSAAPHYFVPMVINGDKLVDGGLKANNPALELLIEVMDSFGLQRPIGCFLTIGTGIAPNVSLGNMTVLDPVVSIKSVIATTTECEVTHTHVAKLTLAFLNREDNNKYHRFNFASTDDWYEKVEHWITKDTYEQRKVNPGDYAPIIAMDRWQDMKAYVALTEKFMKGQTLQVEKCASRLKA